MPTILAIDPGKMTGAARITYSKGSPKIEVQTYEIPMEEINRWLEENLAEQADYIDAVVIEDFKITAGTGKLGSPDWSLRIIGAVEYVCEQYAIPVTKQFPSNAKSFSTNDKLRAVDMWHKGGEGHANDALRHAMLYMIKHGWRDDRLLEV